jgi:hypothetical protein
LFPCKEVTNMKKTMVLAVLLSLLVALPAAAGDSTFQKHWSSFMTGTNVGPAAVFLAFGGTVRYSGASAKVETANVTSDLAGSTITWLTEDNTSTTVDAASAAAQTVLFVTATTGFDAGTAGAGDYIVVYDGLTKEFEVNRISSITAGADLCLVSNLVNSYATTASVYEMKTLGSAPVGNATKDWPTITVYGENGKFLGWVVNGTSACSVNYISGTYVD